MSARGRIGAFFDLDGTLISGYSALTFAEERVRRRDISLAELVDLGRAWAAGDDEQLVTTAMRAFNGRTEAEMDELGERLFERRIAGSIHPEARDLVRSHQRRGHVVAMATSATRFQALPVARDLGIEHVLHTALETEDGRLTGSISGPLLWGRGKAAAVAAFAQAHDVDLPRSHAYGNGDEDVPFLELVGRPHPVNPGGRLAEVAAERRWKPLRFASRGRPGLALLARNTATLAGIGAAVAGGLGIGLLLNRDRREATNLITSAGPDLALALAGIEVQATGVEHLWSHRPAVFIFNHQSYLDAVVLAHLLRQDFASVAKKELQANPVMAALGLLGSVAFVDRADSAQAVRALGPVVDRLREGVSVVIAPEGTRSATHRVGPFKKGAFRIAQEAGVPIVPIVLRNTGDLLWRGSLVVRPGRIDVAVLPPISIEDWPLDALDERVAEVRQRFVDTLDRWR